MDYKKIGLGLGLQHRPRPPRGGGSRKGAVAGALAFVGGAALADLLTARGLDREAGRTFPASETAVTA